MNEKVDMMKKFAKEIGIELLPWQWEVITKLVDQPPNSVVLYPKLHGRIHAQTLFNFTNEVILCQKGRTAEETTMLPVKGGSYGRNL